MKYRLLGKSGLRVSEICLGTMTFGEDWGFGASKEVCHHVFNEYVERGGNFIDTANVYTNGTSEKLVGEFIAEDRGRFVVATKYTLSSRPDDVNASGNHRKNLVQSIEKSLKRLGTDYIDLYWVHAWDHTTPVEEVMRALDDVVRAGKVLYVGVSDVPAWIASQANTLADLRGWSRFIGLQIEYSLIARTPERELLPMARAMDVGVTAWGAIGGGVLSGKYGKGQDIDSKRVQANQMRLSDRNLAIAAEVEKIAAEVESSPAQVAINWVRQQRGTVIPLIGVRTVTQLQDNLGALEFELSDDQMSRLEAVSHVDLGFPQDFLSIEMIHRAVYGDTYDRLVIHHRR